jgi:hypothetical protein
VIGMLPPLFDRISCLHWHSRACDGDRVSPSITISSLRVSGPIEDCASKATYSGIDTTSNDGLHDVENQAVEDTRDVSDYLLLGFLSVIGLLTMSRLMELCL